RMTAFLLENFTGNFPTWLSPVQAIVIPVSNAFDDYVVQVTEQLKAAGIRVEADYRNEKLGYKIREAQLEKIPYMLVVGENEKNSGTLSVRKRGEGDLGAQSTESVIAKIQEEIRTKKV
ncbi:MAG: threonyl-tRNA synthase, partial [Paenibacillus sp.]|nr:threonyl-tRNA synthase [Paenibacillus sp.]